VLIQESTQKASTHRSFLVPFSALAADYSPTVGKSSILVSSLTTRLAHHNPSVLFLETVVPTMVKHLKWVRSLQWILHHLYCPRGSLSLVVFPENVLLPPAWLETNFVHRE
jgi:hypothetical protein